MSLSTLIGLVWVGLVSTWARGWNFDVHVWVFWVGVAYIVVRLLEILGVFAWSFPVRVVRKDPSPPAA